MFDPRALCVGVVFGLSRDEALLIPLIVGILLAASQLPRLFSERR